MAFANVFSSLNKVGKKTKQCVGHPTTHIIKHGLFVTAKMAVAATVPHHQVHVLCSIDIDEGIYHTSNPVSVWSCQARTPAYFSGVEFMQVLSAPCTTTGITYQQFCRAHVCIEGNGLTTFSGEDAEQVARDAETRFAAMRTVADPPSSWVEFFLWLNVALTLDVLKLRTDDDGPFHGGPPNVCLDEWLGGVSPHDCKEWRWWADNDSGEVIVTCRAPEAYLGFNLVAAHNAGMYAHDWAEAPASDADE